MATLRVHKEKEYATIANSAFNDRRLSYRARGILLYILSKPNDWIVRSSDIISGGTEGRDAVRAAVRELIQVGYVRRRLVKMPDGTFGGDAYDVYETPTLAEDWEPTVNEQNEADYPATDTQATAAVSKEETPQSDDRSLETNRKARKRVRLPGDGKPGDGIPGYIQRTELQRTEGNSTYNEIKLNINIATAPEAASATQPYTDDFEAFWRAYRRKGNKFAAWKRWKAEAKDVSMDDIMDGVARYLAFLEAEDRPQQDAERWVHDHGWESEWEPTRRATVVPVSNGTAAMYAANRSTVDNWIEKRKVSGGNGRSLGPGNGSAGGAVWARERASNGGEAGTVLEGVARAVGQPLSPGVRKSRSEGSVLPGPGDDPETR